MKTQVFSKWSVGLMAVVAFTRMPSSAAAYIPEDSFMPRAAVSAYSVSADPESSESSSIDNLASWEDGSHAVGVGCRQDAQLEPPPYTTYIACAEGRDSAHSGIVIPQARLRIGSDAHGTGMSSSDGSLWDRITFNGPTATVPVTFRLYARGAFRDDPTGGLHQDHAENRTASAFISAQLQIGGIYTEPGDDDLGFIIDRGASGYENAGESSVTHTDSVHVRPLFDPNGQGNTYGGDLVYTTDGFIDDETTTSSSTGSFDMYPGAGSALPPSMTVTLPTGVALPFVVAASTSAQCYTLGQHCVAEIDVASGVYAVISVPNGYTLDSDIDATYAGEGETVVPGAPGTLQFTQASVIVDEDAGLVNLQITRSGGATGAVAVRVVSEQLATNSDAGAIAVTGEDLGALDTTIAFADGDTTPKSLTVLILGDDKDEPLEAFLVNLTAPTGGATLGSPASMTVSINNKKDSGCAAMGSEVMWMFLVLVLALGVRRVSH